MHQKLMEIKNSFLREKEFCNFYYKNNEIVFETLLKEFS